MIYLLEILDWINFCLQKVIPNNKEFSLFPKICCFQVKCCIPVPVGNLLQWSSILCKNLEFKKKKWSLEFRITDTSAFK